MNDQSPTFKRQSLLICTLGLLTLLLSGCNLPIVAVSAKPTPVLVPVVIPVIIEV